MARKLNLGDKLASQFLDNIPALLKALGDGAISKEDVIQEAVDNLTIENALAFDDASKLVVFVDGGSPGNPGPAAAGVLVEFPSGKRIGISRWIGEHDNNYAEYAALLLALAYAAAYGARKLLIKSDSQVMVWQINGPYRCHCPALLPIHDLCKIMMSIIEYCEITHIPRAENDEAHRLAHRAVERVTNCPP